MSHLIFCFKTNRPGAWRIGGWGLRRRTRNGEYQVRGFLAPDIPNHCRQLKSLLRNHRPEGKHYVRDGPLYGTVHRLWLGRRYSSCVSGSIGHVDDRFGFSTLLVDDVHGFFVLRFAHFYCNPFHADTGGTDADNQKKPRRRTTPGERIMTIGLRKDRLKNEPATGNIRCGIIPHLIFRTAVGLANDMEGIISCTATARVGEGVQ